MEGKKEYESKSLVYKGVRISANFEKPTARHKLRYQQTVLPLTKTHSKLQKSFEAGKFEEIDPESASKALAQLNEIHFSILLELHDKLVFKVIDDLYDVAEEDMAELQRWLKQKMGLENDKTKEDFLSNSAK